MQVRTPLQRTIGMGRVESVNKGDLDQRLKKAQEQLEVLLNSSSLLDRRDDLPLHQALTEVIHVLSDLSIAVQRIYDKNSQLSTLYAEIQRLNTELEHQVQSRADEVQRALQFESMLKRITDKVRDSLDEGQILQTAVEELTLVLGLAGCNASLYNLEEGTSTICYEYIESVPKSRGKVAQMDRFPEIYRQLKQGLSFQFCSLMPNPERGNVALLACPIFVDEQTAHECDRREVLGDLWLIHHTTHVFSEFEMRMVQQVANQCAIAIRQARLYQASQGQVKELERLNRLKDEFLSTVSHELRTPISNVRMAIHMLKQAPTDERRQRYFEVLEKEAAREAELIDDLLDLQRLEADSYPIELETQDLHQWIPNLTGAFQSRLTNREQILETHCPPDTPDLISDFRILGRVLSELLNNACKYTPAQRKIVLNIRCEDLDPDIKPSDLHQALLCTVSNQTEIPAAELPHIFDKFYRVPHADPWKQGGTGLGLALVKKLVNQLNGTIHVESADGWTQFAISIPVQIVPMPQTLVSNSTPSRSSNSQQSNATQASPQATRKSPSRKSATRKTSKPKQTKPKQT